MVNAPALNYWKYTGYSKEDITPVMAEIDSDILAARVEFLENDNLHITITQRVEETKEGHVPVCMRFLHDIATSYGSGRLRGSFVVWLEDGMWEWYEHLARRVPMLAFGRRCLDHQTLLIPDAAFLGAFGYKEELADIEKVDSVLTWPRKKPAIFWRGATSGIGLETDNWKSVPRIALALKSEEIGDPDKLDAYISHIIEFRDPQRKQDIIDAGIVREYRKFEEFLQYRYLVDVDGFSCAWKSLFLKLASQCLVLKAESPFMQWYYDKLEPWTHYIPLRKDFNDIGAILEWLPAHDAEAEKIARQGAELARSITYDDALKETTELLEKLFRCQRD